MGGLLGTEDAEESLSSSLSWSLLDEARRCRTSGLDRARLDLVGDANEGRFSRDERRVALSIEEGSLVWSTGTLVVGEVLRRLGADDSIGRRWLSSFLFLPFQLCIASSSMFVLNGSVWSVVFGSFSIDGRNVDFVGLGISSSL